MLYLSALHVPLNKTYAHIFCGVFMKEGYFLYKNITEDQKLTYYISMACWALEISRSTTKAA
jgi:hypothetical protein